MQRLYGELGMSFLYAQTKKLVACYGVIFVFLMGRLDRPHSNSDKTGKNTTENTQESVGSQQVDFMRTVQNFKAANSGTV